MTLQLSAAVVRALSDEFHATRFPNRPRGRRRDEFVQLQAVALTAAPISATVTPSSVFWNRTRTVPVASATLTQTRNVHVRPRTSSRQNLTVGASSAQAYAPL